MYGNLKICVVIPAHEENLLLPRTLETIPSFVDQIIVINDGSTDGTGEIANQWPDQRVNVVHHSENKGVGAAIVTGYCKALELDADAVVVVGADAQMDPDEMNSLIDPLVADQADYVKGDRLGHPELKSRMPLSRRIGNAALTVLTRWSSGYEHIRDSQCGYTAISARTLRSMDLKSLYCRYGFPNDVLAKLAEVQARVVDRPVSPIYGSESSGIRIHKVVFPIFWLLIRSGVRRHMRQRLETSRLNPNPSSQVVHRR